MTTHEYWIKHKKEMSEQHKKWAKKNPGYAKDYYWKNRDKICGRQRVKDYKLPRWTVKEIELLIRGYPTGNLKKLAKKLNRAIITIQSKAQRLGIFRRSRINLGKKNGMWKGGTQFQYYRRIAFENLPHVCSICGYWYPNLEVHHKDKNRKNNVLSNLQIVCTSCHRGAIHGMRPHKCSKPNKKYQPGTPRSKRK